MKTLGGRADKTEKDSMLNQTRTAPVLLTTGGSPKFTSLECMIVAVMVR